MSKSKDPTITEALRAYESMSPEEQLRRYRGLLKSHRQLEARVREDDRATQWWKGRSEVLDTRARELGAKLGAALNETRALMKTVGLLEAEAAAKAMTVMEASWPPEEMRKKMEEGGEKAKGREDNRCSQGVNAATQTDFLGESGKDIATKALVQTLWKAQSKSAMISAKGVTCECESAKALKALFPRDSSLGGAIKEEDPLGAMLAQRKTRGRRGRSRSRSLDEWVCTPIGAGQVSLASSTKAMSAKAGSTTKSVSNINDTAANLRSASQASKISVETTFTIEGHPETFSKARKERKQALKMKLKATREMVDGLRKENGVLEGLLGEGGGEMSRVELRG